MINGAFVCMLARVCILADDRASLVSFKKAAVNGSEVPMKGNMEYRRGQRKPAEKWPYSNNEGTDNDEDDGPTTSKQVWQCTDVCIST